MLEFDFVPYLLPDQLPGTWALDRPIELLPALRHAYPRCVDDSIISAQLCNQPCSSGSDFHFVVVRASGEVRKIPVAPFTEDDEDNYDFADMPRDVYPFDVVSAFFRVEKIDVLQRLCGLFELAAFGMLLRLSAGQSEIQRELQDAEDVVRSHEQRIDFLVAALNAASGHLAEQAGLVSATAKNIRAQSAFGLRAEANESRWVEVGAEAWEPSALFERTFADVASAASEEFKLLPRAVQVAWWFEANASEFSKSPRGHTWEPPASSIGDMKLWSIDELLDGVAKQVMGAAGRDYGDAVLEGRKP